MKTALITGGAQGIGRGIVQRLRADGWHVALFDLDGEAVAEMQARDPGLLALTVDVADEAGVQKGFARIRDWLDGAGLDLLVSNAGIADPRNGPIEDLSLGDWRRMLDSHVTGAFLTVRAAVPLLRAARGSIVLMSSTRALQSEADTESYAASKGALLALSHALAVSLGPEVRVNSILPGWIETAAYRKRENRSEPHHSQAEKAQHPVGRIGDPQDVAGLVAYLAWDQAGFVTGQRFVVDGGMSARMIYPA
ncbi:SDR family oxidoreductase [Paracoccus sp. S3-43]|uniref:SDR family oxidoreductase n=1 Tax=Paracoccus sp. S3-43 TaxID=3030011 RepID=UPI0023AF9C29|nr:SDR family oxidoreductase [Paracoccus sp. S3-43]WEF22904.1 SDR family oxidoreductase [Paracoccus sp. S3-43]